MQYRLSQSAKRPRRAEPRRPWQLGRVGRLLILLTLPTLLGGCGRVREISRCRNLAREVNAALDQAEQLGKQPGKEGELARHYAQLAERLKPLAQADARLTPLLQEYVSVLEATSSALRRKAADAHPTPAREAELRRELERLVRREKAAALRIDAECHS